MLNVLKYDPNEQTEHPGVIAIKFKIDDMVKPLGGFLVNNFFKFKLDSSV